MAPSPPASPLILDETGQPRSSLYGDIYFSTTDGLAEARAVFLQGCGLPQAWAGLRRFVVGELGFGTGLNILALLDLWRRERPPGAHLHVFSVEAHLISRETAASVLEGWPELAPVAAPVLAQWPPPARGFHRIDLPQFNATIDLAIMEVAPALAAWSGEADAWFLDGFSPALNPQMWRQEVLDLVAARSRPAARIATFTVAGAVRRGLQAAGFEVGKRAGFGRKRERLEAWRAPAAPLPGLTAQSEAGGGPVALIGAGVAGASVARALQALGMEVALYEAENPGAGASGNPAALVTPRLDAGLGPEAELFSQALRRAAQLYGEIPGAVLDRGVLQLAVQPRDEGRFARIADSDLFPPGALRPLSAAETGDWMGRAAGPGLAQDGALVVRPVTILQAWLPRAAGPAVTEIQRDGGDWRLMGAQGELGRARTVVICAGASARRLADLPLRPVRGQISIARSYGANSRATAWGGYLAPVDGDLMFGATHDRDDDSADLRLADHARNLKTLSAVLPDVAGALSAERLAGRAAVRAVTPDRLPLAGPVAPGLHVLGGLGARGFCLAPLLAEHVAALILGAPSPLPRAQSDLLDPDRFRRRALRRGRPTG